MIYLDLPSNLPSVLGNRRSLRIIFNNLLNNALRELFKVETPAQQKIVRVKASLSKEGKEVVIETSDSGPGIPNEDRDKIGKFGFSKNKSSGSGLAFVKLLVRELGGKFDLAPYEEGKGAKFIITVPNVETPVIAGNVADKGTVTGEGVRSGDPHISAAKAPKAAEEGNFTGNEVESANAGKKQAQSTEAPKAPAVQNAAQAPEGPGGVAGVKFIGAKTFTSGATGLVVEIPVSLLKQLYTGEGISFKQTLSDSFGTAKGWAIFGANQGFAMRFMGMTEHGAARFAFMLPAALSISANPEQAGILAAKSGVGYAAFVAGFKAGAKVPGSPAAKGIYGLLGGVLACTVSDEALNLTVAKSPALQKLLGSRTANLMGQGAATSVGIYTLLKTPGALSALFEFLGVAPKVALGLGSSFTIVASTLFLAGDSGPLSGISGSVADLANAKTISEKGHDKRPNCTKIDLNRRSGQKPGWGVSDIVGTPMGFETFIYLYKLGYIQEKDLPQSKYLPAFLTALKQIDQKNPETVKNDYNAYQKLLQSDSWWNSNTDMDKFKAMGDMLSAGLKGFKKDMKAIENTDPNYFDPRTAQLLLTLYQLKNGISS
jgi:hypothetical protein